ncbi:MAG: cytochrome ubiquinol oxidase subunit I [Marinovum algicola]|uniref:cytochrome ubiquinol oxidase subunit I n=1 Tax=Alphaproteobacteria TaxID=28211 RepID=UPI0032EE4912
MDIDALLLSRIQFAAVITFHIIFPSFTIGLASWLVVLEARWLRTRDEAWKRLYRFWLKIFAVSFGLGVVSGVVMSYQFGTNWGPFSVFAGEVIGPLMGYEVLTAFFLEASFLGIMLFGWDRVGDRIHFLSTVLVAVGTLISAFWILSANSWMHTPAGYELVDGRAVPTDWLAVIFNPSFPYRFAHMVVATFLATGFAVAGMAAIALRRRPGDTGARRSLAMALGLAAVLAPAQVFIGDAHGLNTAEHQPAKLAAMEGHWRNQGDDGVPLLLFAWPDQDAEENRFEIAVPHGASLIITHSWTGSFPALTDFPADERPPVAVVFWAFRVMVGLGLLMVLTGFWGMWRHWRGRLFEDGLYLRLVPFMTPAGFLAILAGWFTTEIGRQPWVVHGLLRTADGASGVPANQVISSLTGFAVVYTVIFGAGLYYVARLLARGIVVDEREPAAGLPALQQPKRPLSALDRGVDAGGPAGG